MSDSADVLGAEIAQAIRVVTLIFWEEWATRYPGLSPTRQWELQQELESAIEAVRVRLNPGGTNSVESLDGSIIVTSEGGGVQDLSVAARPVPTLTKRYYLTGVGSDISGDYLFSTTQPAAADLQPPGGSTYPIILDSPVGAPGLVTWPAGIVMAHIVARVVNAHISDTHMQYPMSFGTGDESAAMLARGSYPYQIAPWPALVYLTADYQTFVVPVNVQNLDGTTADRLRCWLRCNPQGGTITDEQFEIHLGDSYFDTLFTPSSGATVHNDLTGRGYDPDDTLNCHPMRAITPGRVHTPTGATVTSAGGVFAMGSSNSVVLAGSEDLLGIATDAGGADPWQNGDEITISFLTARNVINGGSPGTGYAPFALGSFGGLTGQNLTVTADSVAKFCYLGGNWRMSSAPEIA